MDKTVCLYAQHARTYGMKIRQLRQVDIKMYRTRTQGLLQVLSFIDVYDKCICGLYSGKHCTYYDVKRTLNKVIKYRGTDSTQLIIRSDNGSQFKAKNLLNHEKEMDIEREFGIKHNPNSQAYIESFYYSCHREFETPIYYYHC